jgi:outer membrane lipoprotein-sorting protein
MRWLFAVLGWLLLAPVAPAQEAAQKLYEAMEQKLKEAKAYQFDFELHVSQKSDLAKGKGSLVLATDNRLKFTFAGTLDGRPSKSLLVSDGKKLVNQNEYDGKPRTTTKTVSAKLSAGATFILGRAGLFAILGAVTEGQDPKGAGEWKLSDFKTIGPEKIGDRDTQAIAYQVLPPGEKTPWACKLWLDTQTGLPLKRLLEVAAGAGKPSLSITETYTPWELDPKLPDGTFTLPK